MSQRYSLQHYLDLVDELLTHGRQHLPPDEWKVFTRRLVGTPLEHGYSAQEQWTARQMVAYYFPRLSPEEQAVFVQQHRAAQPGKGMPCS